MTDSVCNSWSGFYETTRASLRTGTGILTRDASLQVGQQALMIQARPAGRVCSRARCRIRAPQSASTRWRSASARSCEPVSRRSAVGVNHTRPMTVWPALGWVSSLVTTMYATEYATESSSALSRLAPSMWASPGRFARRPGSTHRRASRESMPRRPPSRRLRRRARRRAVRRGRPPGSRRGAAGRRAKRRAAEARQRRHGACSG